MLKSLVRYYARHQKINNPTHLEHCNGALLFSSGNSMTTSLKNIKATKKQREKTGCDYDYESKLSAEELDWLDQFNKGYYNGDRKAIEAQAEEAGLSPERAEEHLKDANYRRYRATQSDAMAVTTSIDAADFENIPTASADTLSPELLTIKKLMDEK